MSTPPTPPTPPPGGYYAPPPPGKGNSAGCWKAAGLTCGVLFLIVLVGAIFAGRALRENLSHPKRGSVMGTAVMAYRATQDGQTLQRAVVAYKKAHGNYPNSLVDLVREGTIDGKILHNDLDPNPSPASISWRYQKPAPDAPGSTPLLLENYAVVVQGDKSPGGSGSIVVTLDGQTRSAAAGSTREIIGTPPPGKAAKPLTGP